LKALEASCPQKKSLRSSERGGTSARFIDRGCIERKNERKKIAKLRASKRIGERGSRAEGCGEDGQSIEKKKVAITTRGGKKSGISLRQGESETRK